MADNYLIKESKSMFYQANNEMYSSISMFAKRQEERYYQTVENLLGNIMRYGTRGLDYSKQVNDLYRQVYRHQVLEGRDVDPKILKLFKDAIRKHDKDADLEDVGAIEVISFDRYSIFKNVKKKQYEENKRFLNSTVKIMGDGEKIDGMSAPDIQKAYENELKAAIKEKRCPNTNLINVLNRRREELLQGAKAGLNRCSGLYYTITYQDKQNMPMWEYTVRTMSIPLEAFFVGRGKKLVLAMQDEMLLYQYKLEPKESITETKGIAEQKSITEKLMSLDDGLADGKYAKALKERRAKIRAYLEELPKIRAEYAESQKRLAEEQAKAQEIEEQKLEERKKEIEAFQRRNEIDAIVSGRDSSQGSPIDLSKV